VEALVDNDVLFKGACYEILSELIGAVCPQGKVGILGAAQFVVPKCVKRAKLKGNIESALANFSAFVAQASILEPTKDEQAFAADLELAAQKAGVALVKPCLRYSDEEG
jgi:hypothetical protein